MSRQLNVFLAILGVIAFNSRLPGMQSNCGFQENAPFVEAKSDTDEYGYYFDTGVPYNWVDITGIGTEVMGLDDDNNVGPFDIGFEFPYYWYRTTRFWVNANGGVSLSSGATYIPQIHGWYIPNSQAPNDLIVPLGTDLTFHGFPNAKCYYYTNNVDTLIVSFHEVAAWTMPSPTGSHTFQMILVASDSTIVFHYGSQQGSFYLNNSIAGMQNVTGRIGLQYAIHWMPTTGEVVKFIPPVSTSYEAKDAGVFEALSEGSKGIFVPSDHPKPLAVTAKNYGNVQIPTFSVELRIRDDQWITYFCDTLPVYGLAAGDTATVSFGEWTPTICKTFTAKARTLYDQDINDRNNKIEVKVIVSPYPGWLTYDSDPDSAESTRWLGTGGGWGQEFEPPSYPAPVESIAVAVATAVPTDISVCLMDDDGVSGGPGAILHAESVPVSVVGFRWYSIRIPRSRGMIREGKFYVGIVRMDTDSMTSMMWESDRPLSRRGWEYLGAWAPNRSANNWEFLIRAFIREFGPALVSPNGGERWLGAASHDIIWQCDDSTLVHHHHFRVLFSTDGGTTYPDTIAHSVPFADTLYSWTPPDTSYSACRIKIQALSISDSILTEDESDSLFAITDIGTEERSNSQLSMGNGRLSIHPNPFMKEAVISCQLPVVSQKAQDDITHYTRLLPTKEGGQASHVTLGVYDLGGRLVKFFPFNHSTIQPFSSEGGSPPEADEPLAHASGGNQVTWDGKDNSGKSVSAGIYLCRLDAGGFRLTKKLILMR